MSDELSNSEVIISCKEDGNWENFQDLLPVFTAMKALGVKEIILTNDCANSLNGDEYKFSKVGEGAYKIELIEPTEEPSEDAIVVEESVDETAS
jgi:hypothetical protein